MKNTSALTVVLAIAAVAIAAYFLTRPAPEAPAPEEPAREQETFSNPALGVAFMYPVGPDGYVLFEMPFEDPENALAAAFMLMRTEDAQRPPPENSEGPPVMAVYVFRNTERQQARAWAEDHIQYSNIQLQAGGVEETVVGGANAIRYLSHGLYTADAAVVAHGEHVYLFVGQFLREDSAIRRDFEPLLASVRFIPQPGQE